MLKRTVKSILGRCLFLNNYSPWVANILMLHRVSSINDVKIQFHPESLRLCNLLVLKQLLQQSLVRYFQNTVDICTHFQEICYRNLIL
jgi:hypothetical protein